LLKEHGFAFFESFNLKANTVTVAKEFGIPIEIPNIPVVQRLLPKYIEESKPNLYSGNFGLGSFPLHSDLAHWYIPPRYLLLRCIVPSDDVFTGVVLTKQLVSEMKESDIDRAIFKPRKRQNGEMSLLKFKQKSVTGNIYRWDSIFLKSSNNSAEKISNLIVNANKVQCFTKKYFLNFGDTLLIDNWNILHCRSEITPRSDNRVIERVYFSEITI
jgi:L-asparagine oxygenase